MAMLPAKDRDYLASKSHAYEEVRDGGYNGLIIRNIALPAGRFDSLQVDILFLLPSGYPDVPVDMFYTFPWIKLTNSARYPRCADQPRSFNGRTWQRWSRHSSEWRPGHDGIRTMLIRAIHAIEMASF